MAYKLSDLIEVRPVTGGIEVICEANTSHMSKAYFVVRAKGAHISAADETARHEDQLPTEAQYKPPMLELRICPTCMVEFLGYVNNQVGELAGRR